MGLVSGLNRLAGAARSRWQGYWRGDGFRLSYAACRVALGVAILWTLPTLPDDYGAFLAQQNPRLYDPVGVLGLFGSRPPPAAFFDGCRAVVAFAGWLVIVGLFSRLSLLACTFCLACLCSLEPSFEPVWSHGHPPVLLPALAMLVGPRSPLSLDALLRRLLTGASGAGPEGLLARGPVLLGRLAVAGVFANAALYKLYLGNNAPLAWVYSDNMRNVLVYQYWVLDQEMPAWLQFVVTHSWAYRGMALANVVTQITPLLACFLIRRPILRALCGCLFVVEVVGLGTVMGLWNPHWLPLAAFFIDWDRLAAWAGARARTLRGWLPGWSGLCPLPPAGGGPGVGGYSVLSTPTPALPHQGGRRRRQTSLAWLSSAQMTWAVVFLGFFAYVGLFHKQQRRYTYPFTAFPMYSGVLAERPYGEHRPCFLLGSRWEFEADPPLPPEALRWVWRSNYAVPWDVPDLHEAVMQVKSQVEGRYGTRVSRVRVERTVFEIPRYPEYQPRPCLTGAAYEFDGAKHRILRAKVGRDRGADPRFFIAPEPSGLARPQYRFGYRPLAEDAVRPLKGEWRDGRFYFADPGVGLFAVVAWVRDEALGPDEVCFAADVVRGRGP